MKKKLFSLFLMILITVSVAQPIFAEYMGDTKITRPNGAPINDITISPGEPIKLQARLYRYNGYGQWQVDIARYLDFYVYKSNADGTNGDLVWSDTAMLNIFTDNANPSEFILKEEGTYNLEIKFNGFNDGYVIRHPSQTNAKIYVKKKIFELKY